MATTEDGGQRWRYLDPYITRPAAVRLSGSFLSHSPSRKNARFHLDNVLSLKRKAASLALLFISVGLALTVGEAVARIVAPKDIRSAIFEHTASGYRVNRSKGVSRHVSDGVSVTYQWFPPHLRGTRPPRGKRRILVLGDSYTFGWLVDYEASYVGRLQDSLDATFGPGEVALLNAAAGGMGTADQLAFLEDFGETVSPAVVILFVSVDDFRRAEISDLYRVVDSSAGILSKRTSPRNLREYIARSRPSQFVFEHSHLGHVFWRAHHVVFRPHLIRPNTFRPVAAGEPAPDAFAPVSPRQLLLARALFRRMKTWTNTRGVPLIVINNGWRRYDWLMDFLESEGIVAFDASPGVIDVIARDPRPYKYTMDGHPNAAGHAMTANASWPFLREYLGTVMGAVPKAGATSP